MRPGGRDARRGGGTSGATGAYNPLLHAAVDRIDRVRAVACIWLCARVLRRDRGFIEVGRADAEPLDVGCRQIDRVVRHIFRTLHVDGQDLEAIWVGIEETKNRNVQRGTHLIQEKACADQGSNARIREPGRESARGGAAAQGGIPSSLRVATSGCPLPEMITQGNWL